jgi:hypothetical protein
MDTIKHTAIQPDQTGICSINTLSRQQCKKKQHYAYVKYNIDA